MRTAAWEAALQTALRDCSKEAVCVCVCVCVTQSCPTLCDPMDYNPPGSSVHGILQARILEYVAIAFSKREAVGEGQYVRFGEGGVPCNKALTLQVFSAIHEHLLSSSRDLVVLF